MSLGGTKRSTAIKALLGLTALAALLAMVHILSSVDAESSSSASPYSADIDALKGGGAQIKAALQRDAVGETASRDLQLASRIRELEAQVAELRREIRGQELSSRRTEPEPMQRPSGPTDSEELSRNLDQKLANMPDTIEARRLVGEVDFAITRALPQRAYLQHLHCGSSLCRAEISYPDLRAYQAFVETHLPGTEESIWTGATFVHLSTNPPPQAGEVIATLYLARDGFAFDAPQ